jgi:hypothetical protein
MPVGLQPVLILRLPPNHKSRAGVDSWQQLCALPTKKAAVTPSQDVLALPHPAANSKNSVPV